MFHDEKSRPYRSSWRRKAVQSLAVSALALVALPAAGSLAHNVASKPAAHSRVTATINLGVKNFAEEQITADMYQLLLQKHGFAVNQHQLAETNLLQSAMLRGQIDMYPEYTGTGLVVLGYTKPVINAVTAYDMVKTQYEKKFHFTWLEQAPMNDTNGVGVSKATASKYHLKTLADLAKVAGQLTFAEDPACKTRPDCLAGLTAHYGINFKSVQDISSTPLRYQGLVKGQFDVIEVFTTDGPIKPDHVVVLKDNKHAVFPADHIAPIVRDPILKKYPQIKSILNPLAPFMTTKAMIKLNGEVLLQNKDAMTVARQFLTSKHLL